MTPEALKVILDAKRGIKDCNRMHAELSDRIARLQQIDLVAASASNAGQLQRLLEIMQAAAPRDAALPDEAPRETDPELPRAA